ncbi:MAG: type I DNA topoisomerase [Myxococcota bacterium]
MAKSLLIVESPAKAKTIQKYVGNDYEVMASKGHIKDLPKRGGVDVEQGFQETYELLQEKGKAEVVKTLKQKAKSAERILLATDPDREGEAIAWHLMEEVKKANGKADVRRVLFNEITKKGVQEGLEQPRDLDPNLYEAQRTRRVLDRIGGYPLSNLLWRKLAFGLSAGRVQTPALRLIVDRQREIEQFVPTHYWLVDAMLQGAKPPKFTASLVQVDGEKLEKVGSRPAATSEIDAARYVGDLKKASYRVAKITRREQRRKAPPPYTTSKLQQDASNRLGMTPKRAMSVAQRLYEGVALGRGKNAETVGLITYMRTDSMRLSPDAVDACRGHIAEHFGDAYLPDKPVFFKGKKQNVQDAHEAIRPTRMDLPPDAVKKHLKEDQLKLYKLIWDRFVACQMVPAVYDQTSVDIEAAVEGRTYGLRASGSILKFAGWKAVYGATAQPLAGEEEPAEDEAEERDLPELTEGETLSLVDPPGAQSHHKQTEPPPYYNEASLVKKLEEEGIGRPSTYAEILSKVQARDYVKKEGGKLIPTELGRLVVDRLVRDGFDLADIGFTRKLEEDLDAVAEARAKRLDVLAPFHERLQRQIEKSLEQKGKWWPEPEDIGEQCPECGKPLVKRWGRNGPFIGCTGYPDCSYTRNVATAEGEEGESRQPEPTDYKCDKCGSVMLKRWGRNGWFLGCSAFPKCKNTMPVPLGIKCPKCKTGELIEVRARGKNRRPFYGCTNYQSEQKCDFRLFQRPVLEPCPACGAPFLVRGGSKEEPTMKCHREACDYSIPLEEFEQQQEAKKAAGAPDLKATGTEES